LILSNYNFRIDHTIDALGLKKEKCVQISFSFSKIAFENYKKGLLNSYIMPFFGS
jgi:hypothetical protein